MSPEGNWFYSKRAYKRTIYNVLNISIKAKSYIKKKNHARSTHTRPNNYFLPPTPPIPEFNREMEV